MLDFSSLSQAHLLSRHAEDREKNGYSRKKRPTRIGKEEDRDEGTGETQARRARRNGEEGSIHAQRMQTASGFRCYIQPSVKSTFQPLNISVQLQDSMIAWIILHHKGVYWLFTTIRMREKQHGKFYTWLKNWIFVSDTRYTAASVETWLIFSIKRLRRTRPYFILEMSLLMIFWKCFIKNKEQKFVMLKYGWGWNCCRFMSAAYWVVVTKKNIRSI